MSSFGTQ